MKNVVKKTSLIFGIIFFLSIENISAQKNKLSVDTSYSDFTDAIGLRFGRTNGLSIKHKLSGKNAIEVVFGMFPYSFGITGLYEWYHPTSDKQLNLYYGFGLSIARAYNNEIVTYYDANNDQTTYVRTYGYGPIFGLNAIGGIEYRFPKTPVAISFDLKPYAEFFNNYGPYLVLDPGLQVKLTF